MIKTTNNNPTVTSSGPAISPNNVVVNVDALIPAEIATKAEEVGVKKANMGWHTMFALAMLAGAFIALGAIFATTVSAGSISVNTAPMAT